MHTLVGPQSALYREALQAHIDYATTSPGPLVKIQNSTPSRGGSRRMRRG
jgi:hypothetical protein